MFILSDGRRFRCSGPQVGRAAPSASALERAKGCVALTPIAVTPTARAVIIRIDATRACLSKRHLHASGGPVFPQQSPTSPDGELIVGRTRAFIAFYSDARRAAALEPELARNARRLGGRVERRGATTVLWLHPAAPGVRDAVLACAFA